MFYHAKNGKVIISGGEMDYVRFGNGAKILVMLPGLGDGLQSVRGTALPMALMYRKFAKKFTVYMFSRKNDLPRGWTTWDMAADLAAAMEQLGIGKASILGVSMGGMIAQHFGADYPRMVEKLILVVTSAGANPLLEESLEAWMTLAKRGDHTAMMDSNVRRIYSENYYRKNKWLVPIMGKVTKPKSYDRFLIQAEACLTHDAWEKLSQIHAPTLVIGGERDHCLGGDASREIGAKIPGAELYMYEQWGHGLYEEAKDFSQRVLDFLNEKTGK